MKGKCKKKNHLLHCSFICVEACTPNLLELLGDSICSCNFLFLSINICFFVFLRTFYECLSLAFREFILAWRLEDDLACVKEKLSAINAVMLDADKKRSKNHRIQL
jgi:hypothetical protein